MVNRYNKVSNLIKHSLSTININVIATISKHLKIMYIWIWANEKWDNNF